ncbi:MAG: prepilin peptidase [Sphingomicrobium sp.]
MNLVASAPQWLAAVLFFLLLLAALEDLWRLQIENWLGGGVAVGALLAVAIEGPAADLWQNFLFFALVLGLGTLLFARGWMGGGDIKLLAASALWFDLDPGWKMLVAVAIAGGLEAITVMLLRLISWPRAWRGKLAVLRRGEDMPYGVAIAAGVLFMGLATR